MPVVQGDSVLIDDGEPDNADNRFGESPQVVVAQNTRKSQTVARNT